MSLQTLLGIELPIIQAPMAGAQGSALAIAVSNAGALGSLPCAMLGEAVMRDELLALRASFLSQMIFQTFNGYAMSQFKKIEQDLRNSGQIPHRLYAYVWFFADELSPVY